MGGKTASFTLAAAGLLESTDHSVDRIAHLVGFASPAHFRVQFKRLSGVAPQAYRTTFRTHPRTAAINR